MKQVPVLNPLAAFPDATHRPADSELPAALGRAFAPLGQVLERLRAAHPDVTREWKYSPRSGRHQILSRKKRRILYLVPLRGGFRLMLVLGDRAIESLAAGPCARQTRKLLKTAKRYPEGTAFSLTQETIDVAVAGALIEAKLAH